MTTAPDSQPRGIVFAIACFVLYSKSPSDAHHVRFAQPRALSGRLATNSRCQYAVTIIEHCIVTAMSVHSGMT